MESSAPEFTPRLSSADTAVLQSNHYAVATSGFPSLWRGQPGVAVVAIVNVPVHAVVTAANADVPAAMLDLFKRLAQRTLLVTFANPSTALLERRSPLFGRDLRAFDFVLPDGIGMCIAIRRLHGLPARRVSFDMTSLAPAIFGHAQAEGLSVVLVGGVAGVAARARERIVAAYPDLKIVGVFDGFSDQQVTRRRIAALQPDILICGMGAIRQEAFLCAMRSEGWTGWGFTCGGFLDQLTDALTYYPHWINRANLRWAYRLVREPRRLWRRYLIDYSRFALMLCAARIRG